MQKNVLNPEQLQQLADTIKRGCQTQNLFVNVKNPVEPKYRQGSDEDVEKWLSAFSVQKIYPPPKKEQTRKL